MEKSKLFYLMCVKNLDTLMQYDTCHKDLFENELKKICSIVDKVTEFSKGRFEEDCLKSVNIYHEFLEKG